jgi:hypothetical protein
MKSYGGINMNEYLESIKAEILANPTLAACTSTEELENHCDVYELGDIKNRHFASPAIEQDYVNAALNRIDEWLQERTA